MKTVEIIKAEKGQINRSTGRAKEILKVAGYARVSTDDEDQLSSYKSQVEYYTRLITEHDGWSLVDIYSDEAITGTQVTKRDGFLRMIEDCMNGKIDMVITKSISRFARNTLDTLKYVRMLKEEKIGVYFEDEKIDTLTMDGELLLVILSSVAQQEVENISMNVKKGLKMKMSRGELVGFQSCLGYDYNKETKSITVNRDEAETVKYIFQRYVDGVGAYVIAHELTAKGCVTKRGNSVWQETSVMGIIKNEKYKGDVLQGKTFTVDPISKRRLDNLGEEDQFYIRNHHEPIISDEMFQAAQDILGKRSVGKKRAESGKREKCSRKYPFSSKLVCSFCGTTLSRRSWNMGTPHRKIIWQCVAATKHGKKFCPHCKGIEERLIEGAFVESYNKVCYNNADVIDELLGRLEKSLSKNSFTKEIARLEKDIEVLVQKRTKLVDLHLEDSINKETYEKKYSDIENQIELAQKEKNRLIADSQGEIDLEKRIGHFRKVLESNTVLTEFDKNVFESIVDKVFVGEMDEKGNPQPYTLTFIFKSGLKSTEVVKKKIDDNADDSLNAPNEVNPLCLNTPTNTGRG